MKLYPILDTMHKDETVHIKQAGSTIVYGSVEEVFSYVDMSKLKSYSVIQMYTDVTGITIEVE